MPSSDQSRRQLLAASGCLLSGTLAGCAGLQEPEVELVAEVTFELTETDLVDGSPTYGDRYSGHADYRFDTPSEFRDQIDETAWPDDLDRSRFDGPGFNEETEILHMHEIALASGDRVNFEDRLVQGGRLLLPVIMNCTDDPATHLVYRVQRWRHVGGGTLDLVGGNSSCFDETDSARTQNDSTG